MTFFHSSAHMRSHIYFFSPCYLHRLLRILLNYRATSVTVESVMQRSFREFGQQCKADGYKKELEELEKVVEMYSKEPLPPHLTALAEFHDVAADYLQEMSDLMPILLEQPKKYILPGRILAISIGKYVNQLAVCLNFQGLYLIYLYLFTLIVLHLCKTLLTKMISSQHHVRNAVDQKSLNTI